MFGNYSYAKILVVKNELELITFQGHEVKHKLKLFNFVDMKKERTHYDRAFKENAIKLSFERKNNF